MESDSIRLIVVGRDDGVIRWSKVGAVQEGVEAVADAAELLVAVPIGGRKRHGGLPARIRVDAHTFVRIAVLQPDLAPVNGIASVMEGLVVSAHELKLKVSNGVTLSSALDALVEAGDKGLWRWHPEHGLGEIRHDEDARERLVDREATREQIGSEFVDCHVTTTPAHWLLLHFDHLVLLLHFHLLCGLRRCLVDQNGSALCLVILVHVSLFTATTVVVIVRSGHASSSRRHRRSKLSDWSLCAVLAHTQSAEVGVDRSQWDWNRRQRHTSASDNLPRRLVDMKCGHTTEVLSHPARHKGTLHIQDRRRIFSKRHGPQQAASHLTELLFRLHNRPSFHKPILHGLVPLQHRSIFGRTLRPRPLGARLPSVLIRSKDSLAVDCIHDRGSNPVQVLVLVPRWQIWVSRLN
mmetsp:Transcript_5665/g.11860  ORF Transcript_5665/g.11860 Transcript_5665/m.11860 type:complete len:408 (-) Transcript_5665:206-1429(-)